MIRADDDHGLRLENVTVRYGALAALDGVTLSVAAGERVGVVGPSGSGKTSLLRCLNLLIEPTGGKLYHRGDLVGDWPEHPPTGRRQSRSPRAVARPCSTPTVASWP